MSPSNPLAAAVVAGSAKKTLPGSSAVHSSPATLTRTFPTSTAPRPSVFSSASPTTIAVGQHASADITSDLPAMTTEQSLDPSLAAAADKSSLQGNTAAVGASLSSVDGSAFSGERRKRAYTRKLGKVNPTPGSNASSTSEASTLTAGGNSNASASASSTGIKITIKATTSNPSTSVLTTTSLDPSIQHLPGTAPTSPAPIVPTKRIFKSKPTAYENGLVADLPAKRKRTARVFTEVSTSDEDDYLKVPRPKAGNRSSATAASGSRSIAIVSRSSAIVADPISLDADYILSADNSDDGGISDGDPPDFNTLIPLPPISAVPQSTPSAVGASTDSLTIEGEAGLTRTYQELEEITFASPRSFTAMAYSIAAARGMTLMVLEDRSHKSSSAYMHLACSSRRLGCPFILKLVKAKEGGWMLKSNKALDVHYSARSWYGCMHSSSEEEAIARAGRGESLEFVKPVDSRVVAPSNRVTADKVEVAKPRTSGPPKPQSTTAATSAAPSPSPVSKDLGGKAAVAIAVPRESGSVEAYPPIADKTQRRVTKMRTSMGSTSATFQHQHQQSQAHSDDPYSHSNGNTMSLDRALAPPFERSVAMMGMIEPVLRKAVAPAVADAGVGSRGRGGGGGSMGLPWASSSSSAGRRASFQPYPPTSSSAAVQYAYHIPNGRNRQDRHNSPSPYAVPPHPVDTPQPPSIPHIAPRTASLPPAPSSSLPQWTAVLTLLDPELITFASLLASDTLGCTPASFFSEEVAMRVALIDSLDIGTWPKLKLKKGVLERGEAIWETVKPMTGLEGLNSIVSSSSSNERRELGMKESHRKEKNDMREPAEAVRKMLEEQEDRREREGLGPIKPRGLDDSHIAISDLGDDVAPSGMGTGNVQGGMPRGMGTGSTSPSKLADSTSSAATATATATLPLPHLLAQMQSSTPAGSPAKPSTPGLSADRSLSRPLPHQQLPHEMVEGSAVGSPSRQLSSPALSVTPEHDAEGEDGATSSLEQKVETAKRLPFRFFSSSVKAGSPSAASLGDEGRDDDVGNAAESARTSITVESVAMEE